MKIKKLISKKRQSFAVLIDPDKFNPELVKLAETNNVSFFLVGGSKLYSGDIANTVRVIKQISKIPVLLFPGDETQLCAEADGLLVLSLLSGRNPEYLIEKHVNSAAKIKQLKLATFPVAYLLIESNSLSETQKITNTKPMQTKNIQAIINTAMAAEHLGFKAVYLEAGSGSKITVQEKLVSAVSNNINIPVIVGGGINNSAKVKSLLASGANVIVVGNALEKNVLLLNKLAVNFKKSK